MPMAIDLRSMDKKKLGIIVFSIGAALVAMVLTNNYIEDSSLKKAKVIAGGMGSDQIKQLLGRVEGVEKASQELANRQNILAQQAAQAPAGPVAQKVTQAAPLATKTPRGKRAITLMIDKLNALGGMISPGDHVDIIVHLNVPAAVVNAKQDEGVTVTVFQNVLVLAVGDNLQPGTEFAGMQNATSIPITFALDPNEAGLISFAQQHGTLQLALRPSAESQAYILPASTWNSLSDYISANSGAKVIQKEESPVLEKPVERPVIEIFRGGNK